MDGVGTWTQTIIITMQRSGLDRMQCRCKCAGVACTFGAHPSTEATSRVRNFWIPRFLVTLDGRFLDSHFSVKFDQYMGSVFELL